MQTVFSVHESPAEGDETKLQSLYEPVLGEEDLDTIVYTGTEFKDACNSLKKFCQEIPGDVSWLSYLEDADALNYLYGAMISIMEDDFTEENKKRLAVLAHEIDKIVN